MKKIALALMMTSFFFSGCIWIDDDDDNHYYQNYEETIIYINNTSYSVDNFIDDEFVGAVAPNTELRVYGYDYDGSHKFYSKCIDCSLEWGPTYFTIRDGETFKIYLETSGMSGHAVE